MKFFKILKLIISQRKDVKAFGLGILLRHVLPVDKNGLIKLNTTIGVVSIRPNESDLATLRQVFVDKQYDLKKFAQYDLIEKRYNLMLAAGERPIIIDAGANIGAASIFFAKLFPEAYILALEPDHANAELCRLNCKYLKNVLVKEVAIGAFSGTVKLVHPQNQLAWAVQTQRSEDGDVTVLSIPEILSELDHVSRLLIAKIDIEGFEKDLFSSATSWLSDIAVVVCEPHDWMLPGQHSSLPMQRAMFSQDFEILISGESLVFVNSKLRSSELELR